MAMEWMMTDGIKPFPYNLDAKACGWNQSQEIVV